ASAATSLASSIPGDGVTDTLKSMSERSQVVPSAGRSAADKIGNGTPVLYSDHGPIVVPSGTLVVAAISIVRTLYISSRAQSGAGRKMPHGGGAPKCFYSLRSTVIGSGREAASAGRSVAASATAPRVSVATANVSG